MESLSYRGDASDVFELTVENKLRQILSFGILTFGILTLEIMVFFRGRGREGEVMEFKILNYNLVRRGHSTPPSSSRSCPFLN